MAATEYVWFLRLAVRVSPPASYDIAERIARQTAAAVGHDLILMGRTDSYRLVSVVVGGVDPAPPIPVPPAFIDALHAAAESNGLVAYPAAPEDFVLTTSMPEEPPSPDLVDTKEFAGMCGLSPQRLYELESARARAVSAGLAHVFPAPFVTGWWHRRQAEAFAETRRTTRGPRRRSPNCNVDGCIVEGASIVGSTGRGRRIEVWVCPGHEQVLATAREGVDWVVHVVPSTKVILSPDISRMNVGENP
ncbi:hypothetical protein [Pseudonocardia sp.]|uniref:hypothetical protein n=1 Tax=Pseudonocardia sp. TaxID=60912 RepID=UPI003D13C06E